MITSVILAIFVAGGLMLSNSYEIKKSVTVNAPVDKVHTLIADLNQWGSWDPWRAHDKTIQTEIIQATGEKASQKWISQHGTGTLHFTRVDAQKGVSYELSFDSNKYISYAGFEYTPTEDKTVLTWYMRGTIGTPVIGGYVAYLTSSNSAMIEKGLANIKALAEKK